MPIPEPILVTGGGGMLASAFRRVLPSAHFAGKSEADVTDARRLESVFAEVSPRLVINCAAHTKVDLAEREQDAANAVNGHALQALAETCRKHGAALVHFSTDYVFNGTLRRALRPNDPVGPHSAYGRSKSLGEQLLQEHAPDRWLIIRTAWLYGPGGPNFVHTMLNAARAGKPLTVINDQIGSPTFTHDLAEATLNLIDANAHGIFHVTNSGQTSWFDFARAIFEEFGLSPQLTPTTSAAWKAARPDSATRPAYSVLDCSDYERSTGRKLPDWRDALHRYRLAVESPSS
jgi:dTDP-4-dehydrorhamnose reductase